ncbi:MAG: hypothetical protein OEL53_05850 [Rhodospirillales bacterium]|nr:hypothetical protein [Rhodospirillales bacterium]
MSEFEKSNEADVQKTVAVIEASFAKNEVKPRVLSDAFLRHLHNWRIRKGLLKGDENERLS